MAADDEGRRGFGGCVQLRYLLFDVQLRYLLFSADNEAAGCRMPNISCGGRYIPADVLCVKIRAAGFEIPFTFAVAYACKYSQKCTVHAW